MPTLKEQLRQIDASPEQIREEAEKLERESDEQTKRNGKYAFRIDLAAEVMELEDGTSHDLVVEHTRKGGVRVWIKGMQPSDDVVI